MSDNIKKILLDALKNVEYKKIILFGSRATGKNREDSDYDVLVIVDDKFEMQEIRKIECDIRKKMASHLIDVDILVRTEKMISRYENVTGTVIHEALKEGVLYIPDKKEMNEAIRLTNEIINLCNKNMKIEEQNEN